MLGRHAAAPVFAIAQLLILGFVGTASAGWLWDDNKAGSRDIKCADQESCDAEVKSLLLDLSSTHHAMDSKKQHIQVLDELRSAIISGKRVALPSVQRQHLELHNPLISEVSFDERHRPTARAASDHLLSAARISFNDTQDLKFLSWMPLKRMSGRPRGAPSALLIGIDTSGQLFVYSGSGSRLMGPFSLSTGNNEKVALAAVSGSTESHHILTAEATTGLIRVHDLKITAKREEGDPDDAPPRLTCQAHLATQFQIPADKKEVERRKISALMPLDRSAQTYFMAGDIMGGVSVFHVNGTLRGRVKVTEDEGGVLGLARSGGPAVLFWSSRHFGFFSNAQMDVQHVPCGGWTGEAFSVAVDTSMSHRVLVALRSGEVLGFSTQRGKSKACDLILKFPRVSSMPFMLDVYRGYAVGMPVPLTSQQALVDREIFIFNLNAMEDGYGAGASSAILLQSSFGDKLYGFALNPTAGERGKAQLAVSRGGPGLSGDVEFLDMSVRPPQPSKVQQAASKTDEPSGWFDWFPKIGVFGVTLMGVMFYNARKNRGGEGDLNFDKEMLARGMQGGPMPANGGPDS